MERRRSQEARRHETKPYWEQIGERRRTTRPEKKRHDYQFILFFDFNIIMLNSNKRKAFFFLGSLCFRGLQNLTMKIS